jgi:LemA protein
MRRTTRSFSLVFGMALLTASCGYNTLQTQDEQVNKAEKQIEVQLQRRADLIPNLVDAVKGEMKQEQTVFGELADARARLAGAVKGGDVEEMGKANTAMNAPLSRLLALTENYPQLKSSEAFKTLMDQLEGTENRIAVARSDYNTVVADFNTNIRKFPTVLTAKMFGLGKPRAYFEMDAAAKDAPKVKFGGQE